MTAQLLPNVIQYFYNSSGAPLAGGKLYSYAAGTTTPLATYTDETAGTPNTNPIILNSAGQASVWIGSSAYKFKLTDSLGNIQWTQDNVSYINPDSIDLTKINGTIAGLALAQNGSGALDVQVDNATIQVNGSNNLAVKTNSLTPSYFTAATKLEVLMKNSRDLNDPGSTKYIPQYEWSAPTLIGQPNILPVDSAGPTRWSPNGEFLAVGATGSPYINIYQMSGAALDTPTLTKLPNPLTLPPGPVTDISWSPCGDFLAVTHAASPAITIYLRVGNSFIKIPNPASIPIAASGLLGTNVRWSPNSDFLAVSYSGTNSTPAYFQSFIIYQRGGYGTLAVSGTAQGSITGTVGAGGGGSPNYGDGAAVTGTLNGCSATATISLTAIDGPGCTFTDITTTSTLSGISQMLSWSSDSSVFAAVDISSGEVDVFQREGQIFSGITGPSMASYAYDVQDIAFSPDGNFLAIAINVTPFILIYQFANGLFTQLSNPLTLPPGALYCVAWSANSEYLLCGDSSGTSPYMTIYQQSGTIASPVFTIIANPGVVPAGPVISADWSPTKQFLAVANALVSPYIQVYETASVLSANTFLWTRGIPNV